MPNALAALAHAARNNFGGLTLSLIAFIIFANKANKLYCMFI